MKTLLLVDGNSIINRAFYGSSAASLKNAEGIYTGAAHGFITIYNKVVSTYKPEYACVAFDLHEPTFRHLKYAEYKAGRKPLPEELDSQFPILKEILDAMNVKRIEKSGYEADDIIGTLSLLAKKSGFRTVILSGDKDTLQLVDEYVNVLLPITGPGGTSTTLMDEKAVFEKMGAYPRQIIDLKAIMGDKSDNIPGCPGIGEKGATELLAKYDTLDGVYENIENIEKPSIRKKLEENKELTKLSQWLATINRESPLDEFLPDGIESLKLSGIDEGRLYNLFKKLEFRKLITQMNLEPKRTESQKTSQDDELSLFDFSEKSERQSNIKTAVSPSELTFSPDKSFYIINEADAIILFDGTKSLRCIIGADFSEYVKELKYIFENPNIEKIFFDAKAIVLEALKTGIKVNNIANDLKICAYLSDSTRRFDEYEIVSRYYAGEDMDEIQKIAEVNEKALAKIEADGMTMILKNIELPLISVLAEMEYNGFKIDTAVLKESGRLYAENLEKLKKEIFDIVGHEFNINSPKQLGEVLFDELKIAKGKKSANGAYKTGVEILEELAPENPIVSLILDYRQNAKLQSTYIDGLLSEVDKTTGHVHTTFNQTVTATGRLSSKEPNLQNIPVRHELGRVIRNAFVAENDDRVIVDADYSQIELRLLAAMSGDETMINAFRNGVDIHALTAAQVNNCDLDMVTKEMRGKAKAVNFGIVYGMSEYGLAKEIKVSVAEARRYINGYFVRFPGVSAFLELLKDEARRTGYAKTPMGRRRYLPELTNSKYGIRQFGERVAMNMPIQGAAADIMKLAMVEVDRKIKESGIDAKILLQVHDELLIDAPLSEEENIKKIVRNAMENVVSLDVPLTVSVASGHKWEK